MVVLSYFKGVTPFLCSESGEPLARLRLVNFKDSLFYPEREKIASRNPGFSHKQKQGRFRMIGEARRARKTGGEKTIDLFGKMSYNILILKQFDSEANL